MQVLVLSKSTGSEDERLKKYKLVCHPRKGVHLKAMISIRLKQHSHSQVVFAVMYKRLLVVSFALLTSALPGSISSTIRGNCRDVQIPVTVSEKRFIINTTIEDNWDATSLTFNLTRRDSGTPGDPLPIAGETSAVEGTYSVGATLCGTGDPILVLTHGIIESKL